MSPSAWQAVYNLFFWLHFAAVSALLFYLPFSRFFHAIMSPVIVAYNTLMDRQAHGAPTGKPQRGRP